ncbi:I78 family peptidase inhibitor [Flavobacterium sp. MXW15]|uniref:I78 family peptidase inhibitor n=1 Tax=Xanthomonas chitinilytica TaxID=2989819 RepID=A0ABT3JZ32_9XANT|nr:I78 family peptidase inhibitor [Xanthomonas sp. H13-6]MCW4456164.1 I78 family peptidase inhibitor [Flavobacterium sp. MXW15]MCW4473760.1 I78 family peptidase inhibitor [Xanthomonas sp. H13-6]
MRVSLLLPAACLFSLSACASQSTPVASSEPAPVAAPIDGGAVCRPETLTGFVGQTATEEVVKKAVSESGARHARVAKPGMAMTMDFRQDRLTIMVDAQNRIEQISCG